MLGPRLKILLLILFSALLATNLRAQLTALSIFGGGEVDSYNLRMTSGLSTIAIDFGLGKLTPEPQQGGVFGIAADWRIHQRFGLRTSVDVGNSAVSMHFTDSRDTYYEPFGPQRRLVNFNSERYDFTVAPSYTFENRATRYSGFIGIAYSLVPNSGLGQAISYYEGDQLFVDINNELLYAFGKSGMKVVAGLQFYYKSFGVFATYKHQFTSATFADVPLEIPEGGLEFKVYPYSIAFGVSLDLYGLARSD